MLKNKKNFKVVSPRIESGLSKQEIDKLYKLYSSMDGKHKKFKGSKEEYVLTVGGMVKSFLDNIGKESPNEKKGSGKESEYKRVLNYFMRKKRGIPIKLTKYANFKQFTSGYRDILHAIIEPETSDLLKDYTPAEIEKFKTALKNYNRDDYEKFKTAEETKTAIVTGSKQTKAERDAIKLLKSPEYKVYELEKKYNQRVQTFQNEDTPPPLPSSFYDVKRSFEEMDALKKVGTYKKEKYRKSVGKYFDKDEFISEEDQNDPEVQKKHKWFTIPKIKHEKTSGEYKQSGTMEVYKPFGTDVNVTYAELEKYAVFYYKIMHRFVGDITATTNFLLAIRFPALADITLDGYGQRVDFISLLASRGRSPMKGSEWTPSNEASYRTEYACYKLLIEGTGLDAQNYNMTELEIRLLLLGKIFSAEMGNAVIDFQFQNFIIESKGKKLLGSASDEKHPGMQVDVKKIAQLIFESFRDDDSTEPKSIPKQSNCWFIQYTEDEKMKKMRFKDSGDYDTTSQKFNPKLYNVPIEAVVSFDITKMLLDPRPAIQDAKSRLFQYIKEYCTTTTSKQKTKLSKTKPVQEAVFDMVRKYFSGTTELPLSSIGGNKQDSSEYTLSLDITEPEISSKLDLLAYAPILFKPITDTIPTGTNPTVADYAEIWTAVPLDKKPDLDLDDITTIVKKSNPKEAGESSREYKRRIADYVDDIMLIDTPKDLKTKLTKKLKEENPRNKDEYPTAEEYNSFIKSVLRLEFDEIKTIYTRDIVPYLNRDKIAKNRDIIEHKIKFSETGGEYMPDVIEENLPKINKEGIKFDIKTQGAHTRQEYKRKKELFGQLTIGEIDDYLRSRQTDPTAKINAKGKPAYLDLLRQQVSSVTHQIPAGDTDFLDDYALTSDEVADPSDPTKTKTEYRIIGPFSEQKTAYTLPSVLPKSTQQLPMPPTSQVDVDLPDVVAPKKKATRQQRLILPAVPAVAPPTAARVQIGIDASGAPIYADGKNDFDNIRKPKSYHKKVIKYY